ncbi:MAG TPA: hypothetical protein VG269_01500 [Tepidisphaeraceae bacterium]|jgi:hypothetical protein|nr:hypothetical protein [Tepidisphaeraceae bacterium]
MAKTIDYRSAHTPAVIGAKPGGPWRFSSRASLLLLMVILPMLGALAYCGPAWAVVLYRLIVDGGVMLLWLGAATGIGLLALRAIGGDERDSHGVLHVLTAAGLGLGGIALLSLGLGLIGWLNFRTAVALLAVGWLMGFAALWGRGALPATREWLAAKAGWEWLGLLATPFVVVWLVGAMVPPGMLWTPEEPHGYDVAEYHLQIPREWYEAGRIVPLHHNVFSYFPFNVETHYLLAMHLRGGPWAGMYLAQLMHGAFVVLTVLAVYGFARRGAGPPGAMIATLAAASVPWLSQLAPIAYDEGGFLLFGTLAIGWALAALSEAQSRLRRFALAGVMAGFACGSKLTAVPEVLVFVPVCAVGVGFFTMLGCKSTSAENDPVRRPEAEFVGGRGLRVGIAIFLLTGSLCFAPWLVRNMAWAHNPVFPEAMPLLGRGHFSQEQMERFEHAHKAAEALRSPIRRGVELWRQIVVGWQFGYLLFPLAAAGFVLSIRRPESWFLAGMLVLLALFWAGFTHLQGRFFVLAIPLGALLAARIEWGRAAWGGVALVLVFGILGAARVNARLAALLYGSDADPKHSRLAAFLYGSEGEPKRLGIIQPSGDGQLLGNEDLRYFTAEAIEGMPPDTKLILVGEGRAFWYQIPMSRLRYKTVFDADTSGGKGLVEGWAGPAADRGGAWLLIEPEELKRFARTYPPIPTVPPEIARENKAFVVRP